MGGFTSATPRPLYCVVPHDCYTLSSLPVEHRPQTDHLSPLMLQFCPSFSGVIPSSPLDIICNSHLPQKFSGSIEMQQKISFRRHGAKLISAHFQNLWRKKTNLTIESAVNRFNFVTANSRRSKSKSVKWLKLILEDRIDTLNDKTAVTRL